MSTNSGDGSYKVPRQTSEIKRLTQFGAALIRREIWLLLLVGAVLYLAATVLALKFASLPEGIVRGIQDLGVSIVEAGLVMAIIDTRASREQTDQSLELISQATDESKDLIQKSIEETKRAPGARRMLAMGAKANMRRSSWPSLSLER